MDFDFTSEETMLRKSFAEFLCKECTYDVVKDIKKDPAVYSKKMWNKMAELGWLGLLFEEKYGGSEGSFMDMFILFEEIGKVLLPSPLFTSVIMAGLLLSEAGSDDQKKTFLPGIADGKTIATVALYDERGRVSPVKAEKDRNGTITVNGEFILVPYADVAEIVIFCADIAGHGPTLMIADPKTKGTTLTPMATITDEQKFAVTLDHVAIEEADILGDIGSGNTYLEKMTRKATVLKCGEMIGGFKQVLDMTVAYAKERKQFGVPIGKFQTIQHYCADMAIDLQGAELVAYQAASMMDKGVPCDMEISMAKAWCSDTYRNATQVSHQIHGGVGFTEEFNIGLFFKHAKENELIFGHAAQHRITIADQIGL